MIQNLAPSLPTKIQQNNSEFDPTLPKKYKDFSPCSSVIIVLITPILCTYTFALIDKDLSSKGMRTVAFFGKSTVVLL